MFAFPSSLDLARLFDPGTLNRGRAYQQQGRVTALDVNMQRGLISGRVRGSGRQAYSVIVRVVPGKRQGVDVLGQCSCPVGFQCKHVVALVLEAQSRAAPPAVAAPALELPPEVQVWLSRLAQASPKDDPHLLLYVLRVDAKGYRPGVKVSAVRVRRLQSGGLGKAQGFNIGGDSRAPYVLPEDRRIMALAKSGGGVTHGTELTLSEETGADTVAAIAASGRGRWLTPEGAVLTAAPPLDARLEWALGEDARMRVSLAGAPAGLVLLPLTPPWYLDPETGACGPVRSGLDDRAAGLLAQAPAIAPEGAEPLADAATARAPRLKLPLPPRPERRQLPAVAMVPRLRLYSQEDTSFAAPHWYMEDEEDTLEHFAVLDFVYGDTLVDPRARGEHMRLVVDGTLAERPRDMEAEKAAQDSLVAMGLGPVMDTVDMGGLWFQPGDDGADDDDPDAFDPHDIEMGEPGRDRGLDTDIFWLGFMRFQVPLLVAAGWRVEPDDDFQFQVAETGDWTLDIAEGGDWLDLALGVEVDGQQVDLLPILLSVLRADPRILSPKALAEAGEEAVLPVRLADGRFIELPASRLAPLLTALVELYDPQARLTGDQRLRLPRLAAGELAGLAESDPGLAWSGAEQALDWGRRLRDFDGIAPVTPPAGLAAELRPYQRQGLDWLQFLRDYGLGGVLADDMGLGKTIQTLAHLLVEHQSGRADRPSLVVAPTSLMFNWRREAARFAPDLKVLTLHGPERAKGFDAIPAHDLVLTTYPLLPRDLEALTAHAYHLLILDEAQAIKNPKAKAAQAVRAIDARHRVCLSGTPLENHLGELWALFDFLMPGVLGDERQFKRVFRNPIEREGDSARGDSLRRRVAPFLLRRTKELVASELPPKTEILREVPLARDQRDLYETLRLALHQKVREEVARRGLAQSGIVILDALLKLRQVCCDPRLVSLPSAARVKGSAKLELLMELLPELLEEGRRVLLFSQFTSMLALIEEALGERGIKPGSGYVKLTGQTRKRDEAVDAFQSGQAPLFLISLKAGGSGLNLTAADTVIHYDPWWNPAAERQATDRAHRIGQDKPVFVYKLLTEGTVEQRVAELQARKQALADAMLEGGGAAAGALSQADLELLFSPVLG